ncbi:hypothetical protein GNI_106420, partial [Gregarina niphandrodes]
MREGGGRTPSNFDFSKIIKNVTKIVKEKTEDMYTSIIPAPLPRFSHFLDS